MKSFGNHIDPEKEQQLRCTKIEVENNVRRILKLAKGINGNKGGNLKEKSEMIHLIEDFHKQYESLYSLYEDLRGEVKEKANDGDDGSSSSPSDFESYYSPFTTPQRIIETSAEISKGPNSYDNQDSETSDFEDTILKDKLTSSSEVKETTSFGSHSQKFNENPENKRESSAQMQELEGEVAHMKVEMGSLRSRKQQWEEQAECRLNEAMQIREQKSRLEARVLELEATCKDKDRLQLEVKALNIEKSELEQRLSCETKQRSSQVKGLMEQVDSLRQKLVSVNSPNSELELNFKKKSTETSDSHIQVGIMEEGSLEFQEKHCKLEKEQMMKINQEAYRSELQRKISHLQTSLSESENKLSAQQKKFKDRENELSAQIESLNGKVKNLENKLELSENERNCLRQEKDHHLTELENEKQEFLARQAKWDRKNTELTSKIADQQKTLLELGDHIRKLRSENEKAQAQARFLDSKSNFHLVERKLDEMAAEFRKQYEDKCRIMSRRIRVAEQLHVETKEWYRKTREEFEQEKREFHTNIRNLKDISITTNDMTLKFEDCNANFLNRISKVSCELKFATEWARRKGKELVRVKDDMDSLLSQLDEKEAEILVFREKVWKSENKSRELEKMMQKKEDAMLGLQEEKREAIRQLCVWIDYHRSRSDYYMKMLSEMNAGRRKTS